MLRATEGPGRRETVTDDSLSTEPIPHWPGELVDLPVGQVYVRRAPALPGAEPALFVHGLGGSSTNWTDLIDLLSRPQRDHRSGRHPNRRTTRSAGPLNTPYGGL